MLKELPELIAKSQTINYIGKIENVTGMAMEASANNSRIGDLVLIYNEKQKREIPAEVVGFHGDKVQLMAYENLSGIGSGSFVRNTGKRLKVPVGEFLRGRIIDALGHPLDNKGEISADKYYYVENETVNPLDRPPITERLEFGIKAIDGLNTIGKGQRIGIFAGSGGKSTLMGMIARNVTADINVIALVGERGREVLEFAERDLGPEGMKRSVLVVATSDQPAMLRMKCPMVATTIAEYFKNQGYDVLLMMDCSRDSRWHTARSVWQRANRRLPEAIHHRFMRSSKLSGTLRQLCHRSDYGVYTVLVEGDDTNEPISTWSAAFWTGTSCFPETRECEPFPGNRHQRQYLRRLMATIAEPSTRSWPEICAICTVCMCRTRI